MKPPPSAKPIKSILKRLGCVGFWVINENGGLSINDLSGRNNNGAFVNETFWDPAWIGPGLGADGVNDSVSLSWAKLGITGYPFSVVWAGTHHTLNDHSNLCSFSDASAARNCFFIGIDNSNRVNADCYDFSGGYHSARTGIVAVGERVSGAGVFRSNNDRRAYINGGGENINNGVDDLRFNDLDEFNLFSWVKSTGDTWQKAKEYEYLFISNRVLLASQIARFHQEPFFMFGR